jgi:hypothetical protein
MILDPERIFFERPVAFEIVMIMVRLLIMPMSEFIAKAVIGETVRN